MNGDVALDRFPPFAAARFPAESAQVTDPTSPLRYLLLLQDDTLPTTFAGLEKEPLRHCSIAIMSSKYVFTKGLKELRFLFCQTSDASAPTR